MASGVAVRRNVSPGWPFCPPVRLPDRSRRLLTRGGFFSPSLDGYVHGYEIFSRRLIDAACSPPPAELLDRLNDTTIVFGRRILLATDRTEHALRDHRAVLSALKRGDGPAAEQLRRLTIANVRAAVERYQGFVL